MSYLTGVVMVGAWRYPPSNLSKISCKSNHLICSMLRHNPRNHKWPIPDILSGGTPPPDTPSVFPLKCATAKLRSTTRQNRRQKVFSRGLCVCEASLDILNLTKTPLIYSISHINTGGLVLHLGPKLTKIPRGDGTATRPFAQWNSILAHL